MSFGNHTYRAVYLAALTLSFSTTTPGDIAATLRIFASDSNHPLSPPPDTTATLNGIETLAFGTNDLVTFTDTYATGIHTVEIASATSGYRLRYSPTDPNAINDPTSAYGNPRQVFISAETNMVSVSFQFDPVLTATAILRDAWTMERLENAAIEFFGRTGANQGVSYADYPWGATYATNWDSSADGSFPTNTILYLDDYDLEITRSGYETFSTNSIITNASVGDSFDLGTLFLYPVDHNTNEIADAWETLYFGAGSNVGADSDADGDLMTNREEYIAGTDPTDEFNHLDLELSRTTNGLSLAWNTISDRSYRVIGTTNLCTESWVQVGGVWESTNGQNGITWVETNLNLSWNSCYRINVVPCWYSETNQILINTNIPHSSGGYTNNTTGGPPTL